MVKCSMEKVFNGYTFSWANINVEVANVCATMDTLIDQDGVSLTPPRPYIHQCILSNNYIPMACMFAAYDKHMKCIISFRFVPESRSKVLSGVYVLLHMINT